MGGGRGECLEKITGVTVGKSGSWGVKVLSKTSIKKKQLNIIDFVRNLYFIYLSERTSEC